MSVFQMAVQCPKCGETILGGRVMDHTAPDGVVTLDLFANESFYCENCGTRVFTGDADCFYEYETVDEDEEEG